MGLKFNTILCCLVMVLGIGTVNAQESDYILNVPDDWRGELYTFPLEFAPEIDLVGIEEIRFSPGWSNEESNEFWTYHFTWYVDDNGPMTEQFLEESFGYYLDGLVTKILKAQSNTAQLAILQPSVSLFVKSDSGFHGKARTYDPFFTKDYIQLNIKVRTSKCNKTNKQIVSFDISLQSFDNDVWNVFDKINFAGDCNHE